MWGMLKSAIFDQYIAIYSSPKWYKIGGITYYGKLIKSLRGVSNGAISDDPD